MRNEFYSKSNIFFKLAAVLLCLTMLSIYLVSGLYAKYSNKSESGNIAAVAEFSPLASFNNDTWVFASDGSKDEYSYEYEIKLSNPSEVDVRCGFEIAFPDDMLKGAKFTFNGDTKIFNDDTPETANVVTLDFGEFADLDAGQTTETIKILKVTIDKDCYDNIMAAHGGHGDSLSAHFEAVVSFTQID